MSYEPLIISYLAHLAGKGFWVVEHLRIYCELFERCMALEKSESQRKVLPSRLVADVFKTDRAGVALVGAMLEQRICAPMLEEKRKGEK